MKYIKLPADEEFMIIGFDEQGSKMTTEQKEAMARLNEEAKKRLAARNAEEFESPLIPKEEDMNETQINTPMEDAVMEIPTADEAAKSMPGPDKEFLPDPLEKGPEPPKVETVDARDVPEDTPRGPAAQVTNYLRYTQDTLAVEFDRIFREEIMALRNAGQQEYAHDESSPFANFERGAKDMGIDRKQVLWCYAMKHKDGIAAALQGHTSQREDVRGRINDLIVYLLLLRGIFNEEAGNTGNFGLGDLD